MSEGKDDDDDMAEGKRQLAAERAQQARNVTAAFFRGVCREVRDRRADDDDAAPSVAQAGASPPLSPKKAPPTSLASVLRNAGPAIPAASAPAGAEGKHVSFDANILEAQQPKKHRCSHSHRGRHRHHHHGKLTL